jgi:hypothetical protein
MNAHRAIEARSSRLAQPVVRFQLPRVATELLPVEIDERRLAHLPVRDPGRSTIRARKFQQGTIFAD